MVSGKETYMLNRDLRKQIGCMNGIFQFLDPSHFLAGRRVNGRNHKRLIQGVPDHVDPKNAPKAVKAEDLEVQKEKSRNSMESSRPSYSSSSSCSSMFSSLECNRTVKQELLSLRETGMTETRSQITAMKNQKSHELQDVVKDSLYRQTNGLSVKCQAKDEIRGRVLKHVDSPRPLELPKYVKQKAMNAEGSTRVLAKLQDRTNSSKDARLALSRLSYDGRESREISKSTMKIKELPRLSLDSKASTTKRSALETRLDLLGCDLHVKNEKWSKESQVNQEPGSHNRSSSLVAKLMGLESFPDNVAPSDGGIMKPATVMDRDKLSRTTQVSRIAIEHLQRFQNQDSKGYRNNSVHKQAAEDLKARKIDFSVSSPRDPSIEKKIIRSTSKVEQTLKASPRMKVKSCNTFGRSSESVSPRIKDNQGRIERQSHPTTPSADSGRVKSHSIKKVIDKGSGARELNIKSTNLQLSDDQCSEQSTETRYSSNQGDTDSIKSKDNIILSSQMATEVMGIIRSINTNTKTHENSVATLIERMPAVKVAATMTEQPSPVSVLDTTIYEEDSPSPIKKISTSFQEDECSYPDEALWNLEKLNHFPPDPCYEHNQKKLENIKHLIHELRLSKTKHDEATAKQTASVDVSPNQDHKYINKMILPSGLLEDMNFISLIDQLHSSSHLINPNVFHILEQTEETMDRASGELNRKSDLLQSSCRSHKKVVFDMVNEIYARKIAADGSFAPGRKRVSPQVLIKEIYLEVGQLQHKADCNLDEEDGLVRILNADIMYRSEDWADYGVEFPALVLDIERLIFKDLINEVVTSDTMGLHNWPGKYCRQLFRSYAYPLCY